MLIVMVFQHTSPLKRLRLCMECSVLSFWRDTGTQQPTGMCADGVQPVREAGRLLRTKGDRWTLIVA